MSRRPAPLRTIFRRPTRIGVACAAALAAGCATWPDAGLRRVAVSADRRGFVLHGFGAPKLEPTPWRPSGFNYMGDAPGRLLEESWETNAPGVERDFETMRALGANVVRIHLQVGRFLRGPALADDAALARLAELLRLAERLGLRLVVTGLGAYRRSDVPAWYDALGEPERWAAQAVFWREVARVCARSPAVFAYDLMNEPVVPTSRVEDRDWLPGKPFGGFQFVQRVTLDDAGRAPVAIARAWTRRMTAAIREVDGHTLVTIGLVPWSLGESGLGSGFPPDRIAPLLDFVSLHVYPWRGQIEQARATIRGFCVGVPLVVGEIFPIFAPAEELDRLIDEERARVAGWIGFFRPFPWPLPRGGDAQRLNFAPPAGILPDAAGDPPDPPAR